MIKNPIKVVAIFKGDVALYVEGYEKKIHIFEYDEERGMFYNMEHGYGYPIEEIIYNDDFLIIPYDVVELKENLDGV